MLNIPDPIKALFKRDNVLKNVRVTFPNGEHDDITNDQIVKESVNFQESLATGEPVVFGLCEASSISFECAGVENIGGLTIRVYIEIDISSLTAAQQTEWGHTSSDVPFVYYPVPLGTFVVDECAREADMNIRNVIAYSPYFYEHDISNFENMNLYDQKKAIKANWGSQQTMVIDYWDLAVLMGQEIFDYRDMNPLDLDSQVTKSTGALAWQAPISGKLQDGTDGNAVIRMGMSKYCTIDLNQRDYQNGSWIVYDSKRLPWDASTIWWWGCADNSVLNSINHVKKQIRDALNEHFKTTTRDIDDIIKSIPNDYFMGITFCSWTLPKSSNPVAPTSSTANPKEYFRMNSFFAVNGEPEVIFPMTTRIVLQYDVNNSWVDIIDESFDFTDNNHVELYQVAPTKSSLFNYAGLRGFSMSTYTSELVNNRHTFSKIFENMPIDTIIPSVFEAYGLFGGIGRNGYVRTYNITDAIKLLPSYDIYPTAVNPLLPTVALYPASSDNKADLTRSDYISAWYDEFITRYGSIYVKYKDANDNDAEYIDTWVNEPELYPVYDMSNNILFYNIHTEEDVQMIVNLMKTAVKALAYYKADISMRALPYMEIGDMLFIRTKDDRITMPIMSQTITGIHDLRATVSSN